MRPTREGRNENQSGRRIGRMTVRQILALAVSNALNFKQRDTG
jgi:hypothetical protein